MNNPLAKKVAMSDIASHLGQSTPSASRTSYGASYNEWWKFGISHMSLDFSIDMSYLLKRN